MWPTADESLQQRLLRKLTGFAEDLGIDAGFAARPSPLARLLAEVQAPAAELLRWNDPQHLYMHCLCEAP